MYWKRLRPYVIELAVFLAIMVFFYVFFTKTESIIFQWSTVLVLFAILVGIWFIQYMFSFVPFAILVFVDAIFKNYTTIKATFVEQFIFKSTSFQNKEGTRILTSSEYFELEPKTSYEFIFGRKSKALVDVKTIEKE